MGLDATGCDPMYDGDPEAIVAQGKADIDACREQIRRNPGVLVYADVEVFMGTSTPPSNALLLTTRRDDTTDAMSPGLCHLCHLLTEASISF
jgi:hypothetical protein